MANTDGDKKILSLIRCSGLYWMLLMSVELMEKALLYFSLA